MLFSIITVCQNNLEGLKRTSESNFSQTYGDFEWIVVDGESTDGTLGFLKSINNNRLSFLSEPDKGLYDAMNKGLKLARGDFVIFMNSGDSFVNSEVLKKLEYQIYTKQPDFIYGDAIEFEDSKQFYKKALSHKKATYSMFTHHQAIFYRRSLIGFLKYDLDFKMAADWAFTIKFLRKASKVLYWDSPICLFERGGFSQSPSQKSLGRRELWAIHRKVHKHSLPKALFLAGLKLGSNFIRETFPETFMKIRMKKLT